MNQYLKLFLLCMSITFSATAQSPNTGTIIPQPVSMQYNNLVFTLPDALTITINNTDSLQQMAVPLSHILQLKNNHIIIAAGNANADKGIFLNLSKKAAIPAEGYQMQVDASGIIIRASTASGIFYGIQSLLQLLPKNVESATNALVTGNWSVPCVIINDAPRFGWRGLMLDVSRHFFTVAEVKAYIDQMAKYKFNILHLHLSDDQGWRLQIKSLPKLTEVGAWRVDKTGTFGRFSPPTPDEPKTYGGYYTQDDMKEIIRYAAERFINILPEIDMPGHSLAAIASYPELSCTPGTYAVNSGEQLMVWPGGGKHFYGLLDNTLCPASEKTYEFIDKVFTEIAALFPFGYIHMGGDETARNFWEKSDAIKALMKEQHLNNLDEVQSYFVKRVEKIINAKGKKMIGWDEILQGGLAPNAAVMNWQSPQSAIEATKQGHEVVMCPTAFTYIDYMQGDAIVEPPVYASLRLKKAYQFEPVPDGANAALIKGGQANLWTEQVYNMRHAQYMTWPRAFAIAEVLWSPKTSRNWDNFVQRVEQQFERFDIAGVKYAPSIYDPIFDFQKKDSTTLLLTLSTEIAGLDIHYSFDNSFPDQFYPKYKSTLTVPKDAAALKVITYRNGAPVGRMIVMPIAEMKKRAGVK